MQIKPAQDFLLVAPLGAQAMQEGAPLHIAFGRVVALGPEDESPYEEGDVVLFRPQVGMATPVTAGGEAFFIVAPSAIIGTADTYEEEERRESGIILPGNVSPFRRS